MTSMGLHKCWKITRAMVSFIIFLSFLEESKACEYDHASLEAFVRDRANQEIAKARAGTLYDIPLPSNFSGMNFSVLRVRSGSLRRRGANYSSYNLPPLIKLEPYVKRIAIIFENFGNWSSRYYHVPNHTIVAPVLGLLAYNTSETALVLSRRLNLSIREETPIKVRFFRSWVHGNNEEKPVCAKLGDDGRLVELKEMREPFVCDTQSEGHYTLVVPVLEEAKNKDARQRYHNRTRWAALIGIGSGLIVLLLVICVFVVIKLLKRRKLKTMEETAEKGEIIGEFWVGLSKMPSASMVRTQPALEN
ncbi:uncharacterized protein LOC129290902 [Prosopis cineraria]|uniref:uncharacterized protein LOC129290902 n=1 Tax=Prosopis cineraria TaxID=364024 RepID=UPI00240F1484|nr:uncharacterized protein LOC129290902 [Prosopis cineraria]